MARFNKRGGKRKRRRGVKRRKTGKLAKRVRRIEKSIETKFHDTIIPATAISVAGKIFLFNEAIVPGTNLGDRIGIDIVGTSAEIRLEAEVPLVAITGDNFNRFRVIVGWDRMPQGSGVPLLGDIIEPPPASTDPITALRTWATRKRFRILLDKVYTIYAPQSGGASIGFMKNFFKKWHFKLGRKKTTYGDNTGLATGVEKNMLFMFIVSDSIAAANPTFTAMLRYKFQDL